LRAGLWNAAALVDGDLARIRYAADPQQATPPAVGQVLIVRVPGMDAGTQAGFVQAMRGLGRLAKRLLDRAHPPAPEALRCYLSGGYKAAIPYLIGLVEWIWSAGWDGDVEAFVLHETTDALIPLPLRRIPRDLAVEALSTGWDTAGAHASHPHPALTGYAYDWDAVHQVWKLTPFGEGMREVFGFADPGLGG
jgi:hypothetical protein